MSESIPNIPDRTQALTLFTMAIDAIDPRLDQDSYMGIVESMAAIDPVVSLIIMGSISSSFMEQIVKIADPEDEDAFIESFLKNFRIALSSAVLDFLPES